MIIGINCWHCKDSFKLSLEESTFTLYHRPLLPPPPSSLIVVPLTQISYLPIVLLLGSLILVLSDSDVSRALQQQKPS